MIKSVSIGALWEIQGWSAYTVGVGVASRVLGGGEDQRGRPEAET